MSPLCHPVGPECGHHGPWNSAGRGRVPCAMGGTCPAKSGSGMSLMPQVPSSRALRMSRGDGAWSRCLPSDWGSSGRVLSKPSLGGVIHLAPALLSCAQGSLRKFRATEPGR